MDWQIDTQRMWNPSYTTRCVDTQGGPVESIEQCFVNSWSFTTHLSTATGTVKRRYSSANMWTLETPHLFICSAIWNICFKELVNLNKITWITAWCHVAWPSDTPRSISHFWGVYQRYGKRFGKCSDLWVPNKQRRRYMYLLQELK